MHVDGHGFRPALQQALRREYMPDLCRADAECERSEGSMRARMAVTADDGLSGLRRAELGADDVHDAAFITVEVE